MTKRLSYLETRMLKALQMAYRKHYLSDESIGWDELSDILLNALCDVMGDKGYQNWVKSVKEKADNR